MLLIIDREKKVGALLSTSNFTILDTVSDFTLTISELQPCCAVTTEYGIPSDFVRKPTAVLKWLKDLMQSPG